MPSASSSSSTFHFLQVSIDQLDLSCPDVDADGIPLRKRRSHAKSRLGCVNCRKRRVKCDEGRPSCRHCLKRKEQCSLRQLPLEDASKASESWLAFQEGARNPRKASDFELPSIAPAISNIPNVDLKHMELFHHFNTVTAETLICLEDIWRKEVIPLSFKHDYLMHAILLISATHLSFLNPTNQSYHEASVQHLSKTILLFSPALSQPMTLSNTDSFIATAILLTHHAWANIDAIRRPPESPQAADDSSFALDLSHDPLYILSDGLNTVFMNAMEFITTNDSIFSELVRYRPRNSIFRAIRDIPTVPSDLESFFSEAYTLMTNTAGPQIMTSIDHPQPAISPYCTHLPPKRPTEINFSPETNFSQDPDPSIFPAYMDAASRLSLLLALFAKLPTPTTPLPMNFPPLPDLARYVFSWPARNTGTFSALVRLNDPRARLLLMYSYRAVRVLLPAGQCWWACARAEFLEGELERELGETWKDVVEEGNRILNRRTDTGTVSFFALDAM